MVPKTGTTVFLGPPKEAKDAVDDHGYAGLTLEAVIRLRNIPAVCTINASTIYQGTYLAMEVSLAVAAILGLSAKFVEPDESERVTVLSKEKGISVCLIYLTSVSDVITACFLHSNFIESKTRELDLSLYSTDTVEAFIHFCRHNTVAANIESVVVELTQLCHQYDVRGLLVICEVYLIRDLVYCSNIARLGELARISVKLDLPLLLAAFEVILRERLLHWTAHWNTLQVAAWTEIVDNLPGFEMARYHTVSTLKELEITDNLEIVRSSQKDLKCG